MKEKTYSDEVELVQYWRQPYEFLRNLLLQAVSVVSPSFIGMTLVIDVNEFLSSGLAVRLKFKVGQLKCLALFQLIQDEG